MTVAVVLDQLVAGGVNDAEVTKLVTSAAGLDPKRGDVVTVSKLAFDTQAAAAAKKELDAAAADKQRADLFNMAKTGGLIVLIALALFIGGPAQPQGAAHPGRPRRAAGLPGRAGRAPVRPAGDGRDVGQQPHRCCRPRRPTRWPSRTCRPATRSAS